MIEKSKAAALSARFIEKRLEDVLIVFLGDPAYGLHAIDSTRELF
jgi:hypothetical protein